MITIITLFSTLNAHLSLTHSLIWLTHSPVDTHTRLLSSHSSSLWMFTNHSLTHSRTSQHPHDYHHHTMFYSECPLIAHSLWTALIWLTHSPVDTHTQLPSSHSSSLWMLTNYSLTHSLTCSWTSQYPHNYHHHTLFHSECSPITHSLWRSLNLLTTCQIASVHLLLSCYISLCNLVSHLRFALSTSIRNFLTTTPTRAYDLHACFLHATANSAKRSSKCKVASVFIGRNVSGTRCIRH